MKKHIAALTLAGLTIAALAGCSTAGAPGDATKASAASTPPPTYISAPAEETTPTPDPSDQVAGFGQSFTYTDGLEVMVVDKGAFKRGSYASGGEDFDDHEKFRVTIKNNGDTTYDPSIASVSVNSGGEDGDQVFDTGLDGSPSGKVRPGKSVSYDVGFGIADRKDITLTFSDFTHDDATFSND